MGDNARWEDLCRRLTRSDRAAYEEIFRATRDDLWRYVHSIVRDGSGAHDLVQDVFVSLWDLRTRLDPALSLQAYLYRMARNRAYRHLRDDRLHADKQHEMSRLKDSEGTGASAEENLRAESLEKCLRAWIDELPDRQREALILTRYHELSHDEAAAVMEISPRTVNNHIMRALERIRSRVNDYESTVQEHGSR